MNPYQTPDVEEPSKPKKLASTDSAAKILKEYFSISGSFSRGELFIAAVTLYGVFMGVGRLVVHYPEFFPVFMIVSFVIYIAWGIALGKRSRDIGTTFTFGMIVGMIVPFLGIIYLFQKGKK